MDGWTPAKDVIFSISIGTWFLPSVPFWGLMSQGKTTDVFETHLQQGEAIHLSPSFGGYHFGNFGVSTFEPHPYDHRCFTPDVFFMILTWVFLSVVFSYSKWTLEQNQVLTSCPVSTTLMSLFLWWKFPTNALKSQHLTFLDLRYSLALSCKKWETNSVEPFGTASPSFLLLRIARLRALSLTWWRWRLPLMWSFQLGQWRQLSTWYDTWRPRL